MLEDQRQTAPANRAKDGARPAVEPRPGQAETGLREGAPESAPPASDAEARSDEEAAEGQAEKQSSVLRRHPVWFALGAVAIVLVAVAGFFYWMIYLHPYESTDDAFVDARSFSLAPKVSGYVTDVPVTDNQHVETGKVLFQIDRRDYEVALQQAKAQVESAQASIQNIDAQIEGQKAQIDVAQAQVTQAKAALDFAQQDAARYQDLARKGAGTVQQSQQSTSNLEQQQANVERAQASVVAAKTQIGALEAQKASAKASLANAAAQQAQAELNLGYTTVTAAQGGRVVRLTGARGQYAQAGQSLSMFVPDEIWITANYKETQITDMRPGQRVAVEIDAYPDRKIEGRVDSVQPGSGTAFSLLPAQNATGNYVKVVQRVPVKIVVDKWPDDVAIGPGMSIVPTVRVR